MPNPSTKLTRGQKVVAFIERYCRVPEGRLVGQPIHLLPFQKRFILDVYDNPHGTSRAYLSIARKNGKSALIACLLLAHLVGPEAQQNSQIISGARSRKQASLVFKLAEKMVRMNPDLSKIIKATPSEKMLLGLPMNVEYQAVAAEAGTAHGLSPVLAILDEVGQVKGPQDAFVEAIETAQGAYENPLLLAISTQAATDADLLSTWLDSAESDPRIVSHVYTAPDDCDLDDREAWAAANPALGAFRSIEDVEDHSRRAMDLPSAENSFRWLYLNQRIAAISPFISKSVWAENGGEVAKEITGPVYAGLDLSAVADLTALVLIWNMNGIWHVRPTFWLPAEGLREKARADRVPYDLWRDQGHLEATPGRSIQYEFVAKRLFSIARSCDLQKVAFDRWGFRHLKPWLLNAGFSDRELEGEGSLFDEFGQGTSSMSPALHVLETDLRDRKFSHGNHPVLSMCAGNAVVTMNSAGGRKLDKAKATGRIDGLVALAMARAVAGTVEPKREPQYQMYVFG